MEVHLDADFGPFDEIRAHLETDDGRVLFRSFVIIHEHLGRLAVFQTLIRGEPRIKVALLAMDFFPDAALVIDFVLAGIMGGIRHDHAEEQASIDACESDGAAVRAVHRVGLDGSPGRWVAIAFRVPSDLLDEIGVFRVHGCHIRCVRGIGESPRGQGEDSA